MARVLLVTIGSLGDIHPFIAVGKALAARGEDVLLAVPEDAVTKARAAGLEAFAILPGYSAICERLGMSAAAVTEKILADTNFVMEEVLLPSLHSSTAALDEHAANADVIVGSHFALAAEIVAEKRHLPLATMILQPMSLFSAWLPPGAPHFEPMRHNPRTGLGRSWNRAYYSLVRKMMRRRYAARIDAVRAGHGLDARRGAPILDHGPATAALLCCWSSALGALPPDAPADAVLAGFPFFDSESGADEVLAAELYAFLHGGDAPLVFTLGSFATASARRFYEEAAATSRMLGKRALLLTGQAGPPRIEGDCLFMNYAPHSAVFPHAAAVIHHGGIGTTGQALRAGRPQIVVPHFGDQFDNAARLQSAGIGLGIRRERFEREYAAKAISCLLKAQEMEEAARRAARVIAHEDGAATAAHHIASLRSRLHGR